MQYLLTPLHAQFDSGFGATANAFFSAASFLDGSPEATKENLFNGRLPVNFLYRHAAELFLKSAIVIFHRRFRLPYGNSPFDGEPKARVGGAWIPFHKIHELSATWTYVKEVFADHAAWLANNTSVNWSFDPSLDEMVKVIEASDPRSTFFRYPTLKDIQTDATKSAMKEVTADELNKLVKESNPEKGKRVFAFVVHDDDGRFVRGYVADESAEKPVADAARGFAEHLYNLHAAMRATITEGL